MSRGTKKLIDLVVDRYVNLEFFKSKQEPGPNGCINWTGVTSNVGYGFIGFRQIDLVNGGPLSGTAGMMTTHRLAFMVANNRLPTLRNVNHTCHNRLCVNPAHLVEGTQRDKLDAMMLAGIKGGRKKGDTGYSYDHKQVRRSYRYTEEEIQWVRTAQIQEVMERYNLTNARAHAFRSGFRAGYRWLPCPPITRLKAGRPRKC